MSGIAIQQPLTNSINFDCYVQRRLHLFKSILSLAHRRMDVSVSIVAEPGRVSFYFHNLSFVLCLKPQFSNYINSIRHFTHPTVELRSRNFHWIS